MASGAILFELQLGMVTSLPMQHQADRVALRRDDDLLEGNPEEPFLVLRQTLRVIPEPGHVPRQLQQLLLGRLFEGALPPLFERQEFGFKLALRRKRHVPAPFEFRGHQTICWIKCY